MPWRFIIIIVVFAIFLVFISFNLNEEHRCDISFIFFNIPDVPVFITIFASFVLGFFSALPFVLLIKNKKGSPEKEKKKKKHSDSISNPADGGGNAA